MDLPSWPALAAGISAFILYTASTLSLRRSDTVHAPQVLLFWAAFALISASTLLGPVAEGTLDSPTRVFVAASLQLLPAIHAVWALAVYIRRSDALSKSLRTFGMLLWILWLIPFFAGLFLGFAGSRLGDIPTLALCTLAVVAVMLCFRDMEFRKKA
jgi:uncharacterized repeat protein (TIGR03987 family)